MSTVTTPSIGISTYSDYLKDLQTKLNFYSQNAPGAVQGCGVGCYETAQNYQNTILLPLKAEINRVQSIVEEHGSNASLDANLSAHEVTPTQANLPNPVSLGIPALIAGVGVLYLLLTRN